MPAERLSMRKVREVLRLRYACGVSARVIARSLGIGRTVVGEYIRRAAVIGITWPIPAELDDTALERKLFAPADITLRTRSRCLTGAVCMPSCAGAA
jgi:DNA-binding transcriptional regulator LsrR (DeoR family)